MVFNTISAYLDPANWQQQSNYQSGNNVSFPPPQQSIPPPPPPPMQPHGAGGAGSIRPGSMADQARMANIPMPETAQKCPRCESTNTKFCYFNNYSLSQPRHFCKTCRRYWTRGGALRNVPVGGGCRRNKRSSNKASSSNTSKSEPGHSETVSGSTSSTLPSSTCGTAATSMLGGLASQFPQLRFMAPMGHLNDHYGGGELTNYNGISTFAGAASEMNHQVANNYNLFGGSGGGGVATVLSSGGGGVATVLSSGGGGGLEQWRMQQLGNHFPNFLGGFDPTGATQGGLLYGNNNYQGGGFEVGSGGYAGSKFSNASVLSQIASSAKMEGSNNNIINKNNQDHDVDDTQESSLGRHFMGSSNSQWNTSTTAWTDLSGFSSSSTSNAL